MVYYYSGESDDSNFAVDKNMFIIKNIYIIIIVEIYI